MTEHTRYLYAAAEAVRAVGHVPTSQHTVVGPAAILRFIPCPERPWTCPLPAGPGAARLDQAVLGLHIMEQILRGTLEEQLTQVAATPARVAGVPGPPRMAWGGARLIEKAQAETEARTA